MAEPARALNAVLRRNAAISGLVNAAFSLAFFLLVFGRPATPLVMGAPDRFALDFLPQSAAVALMSALVPVLASRRDVARLTGQAPVPPRRIGVRALGFALGALAPGGALVACALLRPWPPLAFAPALALKLAYGAALGATVTTLAVRRNAR